MDNNSIDMSKLLNALSKMDKKELEAGIAKANKFLNNSNTGDILDKIKKSSN